jgi:pimeloyl-ACP methyl ester carboxylesterase
MDISLSHFTEELEVILQWTVNDHSPGCPLFVLGYSWGGQVLTEFLLERNRTLLLTLPALRGAIISNAPLDEATYERRQREIFNNAYPDEATRMCVETMEAEDMTQHGAAETRIYTTMVGQCERSITGRMRGWSALGRLERPEAAIRALPILFIAGEVDAVPVDELAVAASALPRARAEVVKGAGHAPFYDGETAPAYFAALRLFIEEYV